MTDCGLIEADKPTCLRINGNFLVDKVLISGRIG
jgi:hypothetical protein